MLTTLLCSLWIMVAACGETVVIDSVEYSVPDQWCGKKIDSTLLADKAKLVRLPEQYCFEGWHIYLEKDTRNALVDMAEAANRDSVKILVDSGYRSASFQKRIIKKRMEEGKSIADIMRMVAPPGYSEHETGRAVDLVPSEARFVYTTTYKWLKQHASEWGFVESYSKDSTAGISWEPWHWLYIGKK